MTERVRQIRETPAWVDAALPPVRDFYLAVDLVALEIFPSMEASYIVLTPKQQEALERAIALSEPLAMRRSGPLLTQRDEFMPEEILEREQILADFPDLNELTPNRLSRMLFEHPKAGILTAHYTNATTKSKWTTERLRKRLAVIKQYLAKATPQKHQE